jgi:hypothetical protein
MFAFWLSWENSIQKSRRVGGACISLAAREACRRHVLMRRNRNQGFAEQPGHMFDKPGLAAAGRPFEHHGQAFGIGSLTSISLPSGS